MVRQRFAVQGLVAGQKTPLLSGIFVPLIPEPRILFRCSLNPKMLSRFVARMDGMDTPLFLRRIRAKARPNERATPRGSQSRWIIADEKIRPFYRIAQILLVVVAIFGYFYTVQPVFQKERLEEQVASYELDISRQLAEIEKGQQRLQGLEEESQRAQEIAIAAGKDLSDALAELDRVSAQREQLQAELEETHGEKKRIEKQIAFMRFEYVLSDGSPADTPAKVEQAKVEQRRRQERGRIESQRASFFRLFDFGIGLIVRGQPLLGGNYDIEEKVETYPFSREEIDLWEKHGSQYPRYIAESLVESRDRGQGPMNWRVGVGEVDAKNLDAWKREARERIEVNYSAWSPPHKPSAVITDYMRIFAETNTAMVAELEQVETEYGDWADERNAQRRVVLKHNYEVGQVNSRRLAAGKLIKLRHEYRSIANKVRESMVKEVSRLLHDPAKQEKGFEAQGR